MSAFIHLLIAYPGQGRGGSQGLIRGQGSIVKKQGYATNGIPVRLKAPTYTRCDLGECAKGVGFEAIKATTYKLPILIVYL